MIVYYDYVPICYNLYDQMKPFYPLGLGLSIRVNEMPNLYDYVYYDL